MRNRLHLPFVTVFQNEVLLNSKRVAPYALTILFIANAVLWWSQPAVKFGWATNSDWYIARGILAFSFLLGLPIFNAVIMGDPVIRDFRNGIDPLIFSKPLSRVQYLLGKFLGNFFVLVCCQAAFPVTQMVMQAFPTSQMIVLPVRVLPYFKHFFFFLVITHFVLAVFYFTVGTLTRNSKIVYGLAVCFYPLFIAYGLFILRPLPFRWQLMLDPFLLGASLKGNGFLHSAEFLNQYVVRYTPDMVANRGLMLLAAVGCFAILYVRFTMSEPSRNVGHLSVLRLSTAAEGVYYPERSANIDELPNADLERTPIVAIPEAVRANEGIVANVKKLFAALGVEFRLLLSERSLLVIMPLAVFLSTLEIAFWQVAPDPTYSAAYTSNTAKSMLLFLVGIPIFYIGEAIHRDRDVGVEDLLWSQPVTNYTLLLSKFLSMLLLMLGFIFSVGLLSAFLQIIKRNGPLEPTAYFSVYFLILLPNVIFLAAAFFFLHVVLRNRYLAYAVAVGICAGLFYFHTQGHLHPAYNFLLYKLWTYPEMVAAPNRQWILLQRGYVLALAALLVVVAHLVHSRGWPGTLWRSRLTVRHTGH